MQTSVIHAGSGIVNRPEVAVGRLRSDAAPFGAQLPAEAAPRPSIFLSSLPGDP